MAGVGPNGGYGPWTPGNPTPPGPVSWPAGQSWPLRGTKQVYANDLNQQLSLPVTFLSRKPMFQGSQATSQTIPPNSRPTPVTLDNEVSDSWWMHQTDADTSIITIPATTDGVWLVQGSIPYLPSGGGSAYGADIWVGGSVYTKGERWEGAGAGAHITPGVADLVKLSAGNYVQLGAFQSSPAAVNTYVSDTAPWSSAGYPQLTMRWVAAASGTAGLSPPNPGTWSVGTVSTGQFNSDIRDSVKFLSYVPHCRVPQATGTSIPNSSLTTVTGFTAPTLDNYHAWSSNTWTAPISGLYLLGGQVTFASGPAFSANAALNVTISGSGANYYGSKARGPAPASMVLRTFRLSAGDTAQVVAFQNSGSANTTQTGSGTRFFSLWLSK